MATHTDTQPIGLVTTEPEITTPAIPGRPAPPAAPAIALVVIAVAAGIGGTLAFQQWRGTATPPPAASPHQSHQAAPAPAASTGVYVSAARQQLIGVRIAEATHQNLERTIRTVGTLAVDEGGQAQVHTKIAGWVDRVSADFVGKTVRRGQTLFSIYSPELVATQKEYLLALRAQRQFAQSEFADTRSGADRLVAAARERLRLWDVTDEQITQLEQTGEAQRTLTVASPVTGTITERNVFPGQYLTPDTMAFKIADLATMWAVAEVFEYELPSVRIGQQVSVEFPYGQATRPLIGKVAFIYPDVDPQTRRARIRVDFPNPGLQLKPGTFVTMVVTAPAEMALAIPREAVIDTGTKRYVVLARDGGYFEPREVSTGAPAGDLVPVLAGLSHGDRVVTSAQFLVDSETNLQAAMTAMAGHGHSMPAAEQPKASAAPMPDMPGMDHSQHQD